MTTVSEQRLADYIAEHPGRACGQCGASWEKCTEKVLGNRGACCGRCGLTDTHGADAAQAALRRRRRETQEAEAAQQVEYARGRVRAFLDAHAAMHEDDAPQGDSVVTELARLVTRDGTHRLTVADLRALLAAQDGEQ